MTLASSVEAGVHVSIVERRKQNAIERDLRAGDVSIATGIVHTIPQRR